MYDRVFLLIQRDGLLTRHGASIQVIPYGLLQVMVDGVLGKAGVQVRPQVLRE